MSTAYFDLQPEFHFFLPRDKRDVTIALAFKGRQSLKHLIESLGVPHTEVGQVTVNGQARSLDSLPHNGDRIEVRPAAPSCPLEARFLLEVISADWPLTCACWDSIACTITIMVA